MAGMLERLASIPGVSACAVFPVGGGHPVAEEIRPPYESILLTTASGQIREALDLFEFLDNHKPELMVGRFESGCIVARRVGGHVIIVVTEPTANMAMLNVGMNVAALRLSEQGARPPSSSGEGSGVLTPRSSSVSGGSAPSLISWTSPSSGSPLAIPPDAVGEQVVSELVMLLTKYVGPFAKVMVKEELAALGAHARTLRRVAWRDLVDAIMRNIPQQEKREAFLKDAMKLLPQ